MFICEISARALFYMYIYIYTQMYTYIYIYICSFMCKFRQSVLSTEEMTFCLCVAFCFTARSLWMSTVFGFGKISVASSAPVRFCLPGALSPSLLFGCVCVFVGFWCCSFPLCNFLYLHLGERSLELSSLRGCSLVCLLSFLMLNVWQGKSFAY